MAKHIYPRSTYSLAVHLPTNSSQGNRLSGESLSEIIQKVVQETPPPPSSIDRGIPASLDEAVMKAMEKDPAKRHPDMKAFEDALYLRPTIRTQEGQSPASSRPLSLPARAGERSCAFLMWQVCS